MAIKNIIAKGIGFSPGSVKFIPTHGFDTTGVVIFDWMETPDISAILHKTYDMVGSGLKWTIDTDQDGDFMTMPQL
jgi:hypothetical protein